MSPDEKLQHNGRLTSVEVVNAPKVKTNRAPQYAATIVVNILHLIYGLGIGWSAIVLPVLLESDDDDNNVRGHGTGIVVTANGTRIKMDSRSDDNIIITLGQGSWLTAVLYICAVPATLMYGFIGDKVDRKTCGYLIGIPYLASSIVLAVSSSFAVILVSRALLGIACGGIFVFVPLYVSEIVEDTVRGTLGSFVTLIRNIGILLAYVLGTFLSYKEFEYVAMVPSVLFLVLFYWMPESPMNLLRQKKIQEAEKSLRWLRGKHADVQGELNKMQMSLVAMKSEGAGSATLRDLFATRGSRKAILIGMLLCCNQQLCGYIGVLSYTFMIFEEASPNLEDASNIIVGAMSVLGIAAALLIYDKVRRKVLLLASNFVMIISLLIISIYFYLKHRGNDVSSFGWLPVTAMSFYVVGYSAGLAALPIVILTETFSPKIRNLGLTINSMFSWFLIFVLTITFPLMTDNLGFHWSCWIFIAWSILGVVTILTILPETKNKPLENILYELEHGKRKIQQKVNI